MSQPTLDEKHHLIITIFLKKSFKEPFFMTMIEITYPNQFYNYSVEPVSLHRHAVWLRMRIKSHIKNKKVVVHISPTHQSHCASPLGPPPPPSTFLIIDFTIGERPLMTSDFRVGLVGPKLLQKFGR